MCSKTVLVLSQEEQSVMIAIADAISGRSRARKGKIEAGIRSLQGKVVKSTRTSVQGEECTNCMTLKEIEFVSILIEVCSIEELGIKEDRATVDSLKMRLNECIADMAATAHLDA